MNRPVSNDVLKDRIDAVGQRLTDLSTQNEIRRREVNERLDQVIETMNKGYVTRLEYTVMTQNNTKEHESFVPLSRYLVIERIVYAGSGFILLAFLGALTALVYKAGLAS